MYETNIQIRRLAQSLRASRLIQKLASPIKTSPVHDRHDLCQRCRVCNGGKPCTVCRYRGSPEWEAAPAWLRSWSLGKASAHTSRTVPRGPSMPQPVLVHEAPIPVAALMPRTWCPGL